MPSACRIFLPQSPSLCATDPLLCRNMRDGNLPSPSETKLAAAAAEAAGALMAALAAMGSATLSTRAWVRGVLGEPKSDPVVALVT